MAVVDDRHDRTEELFGPVIHSYTRAQAIADGVLVDVTNATDASGRKLSPFKFPVALTRAAYAATIEVGGKYINPQPATRNPQPFHEELVLPASQDLPGRLWDVFWMLVYAIRSAPSSSSSIHFSLLVNGPPRRRVHLKSLCAPGDHAEPVITILLPNED